MYMTDHVEGCTSMEGICFKSFQAFNWLHPGDLREHKPVVHQASGQRIRKKKDTDTASPELPPESPPLHVPQVRLPEPTSCGQQLQPTAKEFVPMTPWQTEMCPPYPAYQAFSYQAYTPQAFPYYQDYQAYQAPAVPTMPTVPTVPAPPTVPAWTPPVSKISEKNEKMEKHETTRGDSECEDWEELYDSEPGSTEVHSAIPSVHSSPAGPKPEVKPCVAPPWLLCTSNRRRAQQKQAWNDGDRENWILWANVIGNSKIEMWKHAKKSYI